MAVDSSWVNGLDFQWLRDKPDTNRFMQAFQIGANLAQQKTANQMRSQELAARLRSLDMEAQLHKVGLDAKEQIARGHTELGTVLSEIGANSAWTDPAAVSRFWQTAAKFPQLMKDPSFRELTQNFELANRAKMQADLLGQRQEGQLTLEQERAENRERLMQEKYGRLAELQEDTQEHRELMAEITNDLAIQRDAVRPNPTSQLRFDLPYTDQKAMETELEIIKRDRNAEPAEKVKRTDAVYRKWKAVALEREKSRTRPASSPANPEAPKILKFNPATGKIE